MSKEDHQKHLFRIWFHNGNGRHEMGHIIAYDMENVEKYVRISFIGEDVPEEDISLEYFDEGVSMFEICLCPACDDQDSERCEYCENIYECIEIEDVGTEFTEEDINRDMITGEPLVYREDEEGNIRKDADHNKPLVNLQRYSDILNSEASEKADIWIETKDEFEHGKYIGYAEARGWLSALFPFLEEVKEND